MEIIFVLDWILRIMGALSIILTIIGFFIEESFYAENVKIIDNPSENELNECISCIEHDDIEKQSIERTLFVPINIKVKKLKVYSLKLSQKSLKKDILLKEIINIEPAQGHLLHISRGCAAPRYLLKWSTDYGVKAKCLLYQNGFNGNNNVHVVEYSNGIISKIRKLLKIQ